MTTNERRILTEMLKHGRISKGELIENLGLSWATVVKLMNRLEKSGVIVRTGTAPRDVPVGKNSYLYAVSGKNPLAVGVDVEYASTHLVLTNLKGDILGERIVQTRPGSTARALARSLELTVRTFIEETVPSDGKLAGVGITIPAFIAGSRNNIYSEVQELIQPSFQIPVRIDNVVRAYTLFTESRFSHPESFIMVTVRTGIGCGIVSGGRLYRGDSGFSGEISHLKVTSDGQPCRCGKTGCLETVVNEHILRQKYVEAFHPRQQGDKPHSVGTHAAGIEPVGKRLAAAQLAATPRSETPSDTSFAARDLSAEATYRAALSDLFLRAEQGDARALAIVNEAADHLAVGLAALLLTFDISHFYLSGHFGPGGRHFATIINRSMRELVDRRFPHKVTYRPMDDLGFVMGAAKLALNDYLEAPQHSPVE